MRPPGGSHAHLPTSALALRWYKLRRQAATCFPRRWPQTQSRAPGACRLVCPPSRVATAPFAFGCSAPSMHWDFGRPAPSCKYVASIHELMGPITTPPSHHGEHLVAVAHNHHNTRTTVTNIAAGQQQQHSTHTQREGQHTHEHSSSGTTKHTSGGAARVRPQGGLKACMTSSKK